MAAWSYATAHVITKIRLDEVFFRQLEEILCSQGLEKTFSRGPLQHLHFYDYVILQRQEFIINLGVLYSLNKMHLVIISLITVIITVLVKINYYRKTLKSS